ncbi:hypothetical protein [Cryobacterium mannosilyticum]|uniref:Uncharacterized protein n=1 Tax=Cryobacterium mannosilyticum TaxID=1259190 RepID=A0A4V6QGR6_9MICO|nr:hypothetical protein [Cryobacterium mannosilyticum]TFC02512.1 hypothetical protein E3O32_11615 [Cryobacterium mannosilyticum]
MSPRVTGILAMVAGIAIAILGGTLFQYGWAGILGAILIVGASILFAIGATWMLRKSWADKTWPPSRPMDPAKARRIMRRSAVLRFCVAPLLIGWAVAAMVLEPSIWPGALVLTVGIWELFYGALLLLWAIEHPPKENFWTP